VTDCEERADSNSGICPLDSDDFDWTLSYLVSDDQERGVQRLVASVSGIMQGEAEQLARLFLPTDAAFENSGSAPNGNVIQFWSSGWLAEQLGNNATIWGAYDPGTVYVQFIPADADDPGSGDIAHVEISIPAAPYDIADFEVTEAPNGRTRYVMYVVMDPAASTAARVTTLEEVTRVGLLEATDATVIVVFAVSDANEIGAGANAGRAAVSRDGEGLDPGSDRLTITNDDGQIQIAIPNEFGSETVYFVPKE